MNTLHTINKSPFTHNTLMSCLAVCGPNDSILLIEDGAYAASRQSPCSPALREKIAAGIAVYVLQSDIELRGLQTAVLDKIQLTDYQGFVRLSTEHRCTQSWY